MSQNEHPPVTWHRPEVAGDVISGENVKTIEGYGVLNFEVASFSSFRYIQKNHFVTAAVGIDDIIKRKRIRVSHGDSELLCKILAKKICQDKLNTRNLQENRNYSSAWLSLVNYGQTV